MLSSLAFAATLPLALAVRVADPAPPALRLADPVRPLGYQLELTIIPDETTFTGSARIELEIEQPIARLWLNAAALTIDHAWLERDGRTATLAVLPGNADFIGLAAEHELAAGRATLHLAWWGRLAEADTRGLFRQREGDAWYVFSQFEPLAARRAFPGFDEPRFKVPFELSLRVPLDAGAVSNTMPLSETVEPTGHKLVRFAPTPPLPTYLLALAVGPFDVADGGLIGRKPVASRIVSPCGMARETRFAREATSALLTRLEDWFGMPYPYGKLDQLAIPETVGFGAMENPGLITWNMSALLLRPEDMAPARMRRSATIAAHELAHQWFGDLVTLAWWDDLWLNEAFASWMEDVVLEQWKPEWEVPVDRVRARGRAIKSDSLASARRIREPIVSNDDIENAFDGITYAKGATVIGNFERWMGRERFQRGVRRYLERHAHSTATAADFLGALAAEGSPEVPAAFASFLDQPGVPLVSAELRCDAGRAPRLRLAQRRFLPVGSKAGAGSRWSIPLCVRYRADGEERRACTLLDQDQGELELPARSCPEWVNANEGGIGYYVVAWQGDMLGRLLADGGRKLPLEERVALLSDVSSLASAGEIDLATALGLVPRFAGDQRRQIVQTVSAIASSVRRHLVPDPMRPTYARFVRETFGERAAAIGFLPRPGEDDELRLLRPELVGLVASAGEDARLRAEALRLASAWLDDRSAVDREMLPTVLETAARVGGPALFDRFLATALASRDRRDRRLLLSALGDFPEAELHTRALALVLDPRQDIRQVSSILLGGAEYPASRERSWQFVKDNFDALAERMPQESVAGLARIAAGFCDAGHRREAEEFLGPRTTRFPGGPRVLRQTLETIDLCIAYREAQGASVERFLAGWAAGTARPAPPKLRRDTADSL